MNYETLSRHKYFGGGMAQTAKIIVAFDEFRNSKYKVRMPREGLCGYWLSGTRRSSRGMSIIEILLVVAIAVILLIPAVRSFHTLQARKVLDADAALVETTLERARSLTLGSKNEKQYGVHFESTQFTLFEGGTFVPGSSTNRVMTLNPSVTISSVSLALGVSDVIFQRLSGKTSASGTVTITHQSAGSKIITIHETGITEME